MANLNLWQGKYSSGVSKLSGRTLRRIFNPAAALTAAVVALAANNVALAQYQWDPRLTGNGASDGSGTWDTTTPQWFNGSSDTVWNDGNDAQFGTGTSNGSYTVTLNGNRTVNNLNFPAGSSAYTINAGGNTLTINNNANFNASNTILTNGTFIEPYANGFNPGGNLTLGPGSVLNTGYINPLAGSSMFFNGGTLAPNTSGYGYFQSNGNQYVSAGGLTVDTTNAQYTTFYGTLQHDPNDTGVDGGLTVKGTGDLILQNNTSYTGNTNINSGTLQLNYGANGSGVGILPGGSTVNVNSGGELLLNGYDVLGYGSGGINLNISGGTVYQYSQGYNVTTVNAIKMVGGNLAGDQYGPNGRGDFDLTQTLYATSDANGNPATLSAPNISIATSGDETIMVTRGPAMPVADLVLSGILFTQYSGGAGTGGSGVVFTGGGIVDITGSIQVGGNTTVNGTTLILDQAQPQYGCVQGGIVLINSGATVIVNQDNSLIGYSNAGTSVYVGPGGVLTEANGASTHAGNVQLSGGSLASGPATGSAASYATFDFQPGSSITVTSNSTLSAQNVALEPLSGSYAAASVNVNAGVVLTVSGYFGNVTGESNPLTLTGTGTVVLTGSNVYSGDTVVNAGTLEVGSAGSINNTGNVNISSGATVKVDFGGVVNPSGTVMVPSGALLTANGAIGGNLLVNGGTANFGNNSSTGTILRTFTGLTINNGGLVTIASANHSNRSLVVTPSLSIGSAGSFNGKLDLGNNDLDVQNGNFGNIIAAVASGYNGGAWNGAGGIVSTSAASNPKHLTALGVIQNSMTGSTGGAALYSSFDGQAVSNTDVLVKYTYYGDANLDGKVDGSDYSRIDNGYVNHLTGWQNGDFNYDGVVDGSDYTLIDNTYNTQGASLATAVATAAATAQIAGASTGVGSAVPEPGTLSLLATAALSVLARRRRDRAQ